MARTLLSVILGLSWGIALTENHIKKIPFGIDPTVYSTVTDIAYAVFMLTVFQKEYSPALWFWEWVFAQIGRLDRSGEN